MAPPSRSRPQLRPPSQRRSPFLPLRQTTSAIAGFLALISAVAFLFAAWASHSALLEAEVDGQRRGEGGSSVRRATASGSAGVGSNNDNYPFKKSGVAKETPNVAADALASSLAARSWNLSNEPSFLDTIKSCIPSVVADKIRLHHDDLGTKKECMQHVPKKGGSDAADPQRIAILSPPGRIADAFASWVEDGLRDSFGVNDISDISDKLVLIPSGHVPPYGYGKNHGLTKIIRLVADPLSVGVFDAMSYWDRDDVGDPPRKSDWGQRGSDINFGVKTENLSSVLRQIIRWHCRLSHVAAHTAMLSLTLSDIVKDPRAELEKIVIFATTSPGKNKEILRETKGNVGNNAEKIQEAINAVLRHSFSLQNSAPGAPTMLQKMESILRDELESTNNLRAWPCPSFWNVGKGGSTTITTVASKVARALVPDCKESHTKCSVNKDICEERGDALCTK